MYAIRINKTNQYLRWADECWYESSKEILYHYNTLEECEAVAKLIENHYIYSATAIDENGNEFELNKPIKKETTINNDLFGELI